MRRLWFLCFLGLLAVRCPSDQSITRQFPASYSAPGEEGALVGIICALSMVVLGFSLQTLSQSYFFHRQVRRFFADYGMPIALVASSGLAY